MRINERNIFLVDGLGALWSAISTGIILPMFFDWTKIPMSISFAMALPPVFFALYSLGCFLLVKKYKPTMLLTIILANLSYCILAITIAFALNGISYWGKAYFFCEVAILCGVVALEWKVYRRSSP